MIIGGDFGTSKHQTLTVQTGAQLLCGTAVDMIWEHYSVVDGIAENIC